VGSIQVIISSTGTVYPKNRLEIKPPVSGRVEEVLVKEGESVKVGQILAWMSSTERAALLDAASEQGEEKLKYWQKIYKAIPLKAPINGEVIVATTQPGQTVATSDAVIVLSDQLIVRAQVDETDIGKIKLNQNAILALDAYPDTKIKAKVGHIYYESQTVNNVIVYKVDLAPENVPDFFRSGMSASVDFIVENKENTLILPVEAVQQDKGEDYILLKQEGSIKPVKRVVKMGITEGDNCEILSGVTATDTIVVTTNQLVLPTAGSNTGSNPFMPKFPTRKKNQGGPPPG
jgi:macrolide-specific efflux system membrane fusion protein